MGSGPLPSWSQSSPGSGLGSESEQDAASGAAGFQTGHWASRSCHDCNSKKIRCDKKVPCSSCKRADRACTYPAAGPRKRRAKKTIMADMASRIFGLERSVARFREEAKRGPAIQALENTQSGRLATALHRNDLSEGSREDVLVQKGSSSQYFNEIFLSRVIEDVSTPCPD